MDNLLILIIACPVFATVSLSDTIVSIKSFSKLVDVSTLPQKMVSAGFAVDDKITLFLKTVNIETLGSIETQIVKTSTSALDSDELCAFVADVSTKLGLESSCIRDSHGEIRGEHGRALNVNDPDARYQKHFRRLEMGEVWRLSLPYVKRNVKVAVIDTGIDWEDKDFSPLKGRFKRKSGGYIDGGWNFMTNSSNLTNKNKHGTRVCRLLAAKANNSYGMAGIAPNVSLVVLQGADRGMTRMGRFLAALNMAVDLQVDIMSISIGFNISRQGRMARLMWNALLKAEESGILRVSAAPNKAEQLWDDYPCWLGGRLGICITNLANNGTHNVLSSRSAWGDRVDLATYGNRIFVGRNENGKAKYKSGTSYATPIVAGIAAILLSMGTEPTMVKRLMLAYADPLVSKSPDRVNRTIRGGALNPLNTVKAAIEYITSKEA